MQQKGMNCFMTKLEYRRCESAMIEAIRSAEQANKEMNEYIKCSDEIQKHILEVSASEHRGYATGINQALVFAGFKHEKMQLLSKLI